MTDGRGSFSHFAFLVCRRFKALQQHIDELTREKFDLIRGLQTQRKVQESLEAESERFTNDFNRQVWFLGAAILFINVCILALLY